MATISIFRADDPPTPHPDPSARTTGSCAITQEAARETRLPPTAAELHAALLASSSATAVLEHFFGRPLTVRRLAGNAIPPTREQRARLLIDDPAECLHRHVALIASGRILSHAHLWYVPARLRPDIVHELATTDAPFGRLVSALQPERHTLNSNLGDPGSASISGNGEPFGRIAIHHRALLTIRSGDGTTLPIAEVHECYLATELGKS